MSYSSYRVVDHRHHFLPSSSSTSPFGRPTLLWINVGLVGASLCGAAAYLYVTSRSASNKRRRKWDGTPPGLRNVGNSCYANALLQGLAGCPSVLRWLCQLGPGLQTCEDSDVAGTATSSSNDSRSLNLNASTCAIAENNNVNHDNNNLNHDNNNVNHVIIDPLHKDSESDSPTLPIRDKMTFMNRLRTTLEMLNDSCTEYYSASDVIRALVDKNWVIPVCSQQDLYELFNVFVTTWDEELDESWERVSLKSVPKIAQSQSSSPIVDDDVALSTLKTTALANIAEFVSGQHKRRSACCGQLATFFQCCNKKCAFKKSKHEKFHAISLDLFDPGLAKSFYASSLTLELLLRRYFLTEILEEGSCDRCSAMERPMHGGLVKKVGISMLPRVMVLHINRVGYSHTGQLTKKVDFVEFPETLDVRDFCAYRSKAVDYSLSTIGLMPSVRPILSGGSASVFAQPGFNLKDTPKISASSEETKGSIKVDSSRYKYRLMAVCVHGGSPTSGHFVAYRRGIATTVATTSTTSLSPTTSSSSSISDRWFFCNDSAVRPASFREVANSQAYMLFYERV